MPSHITTIRAAAAGLALALLTTACGEKNAKGEGPMERFGRATDNAAEQAGDTIERGVHRTGEGIERLGEKMQRDDDVASDRPHIQPGTPPPGATPAPSGDVAPTPVAPSDDGVASAPSATDAPERPASAGATERAEL